MGYWRAVDSRVYGDAGFRALSPVKPSGQSCWLHLLTGRHTGLLPGVFATWPDALARELGWSGEDYDRCFAEVAAQGMVEADRDVGVIFLPNAITYRLPDNANMATGYGRAFDSVPECALRAKAIARFAEVIGRECGERSAAAFLAGVASGSRNGSETVPQTVPQTVPEPLANGLANSTSSSSSKSRSKRSADVTGNAVAGRFVLRDGGVFCIGRDSAAALQERYPDVDMAHELALIEGWCEANPRRRKTRAGAARFVESWLAREQKRIAEKARGRGRRFGVAEKNRRALGDVLKGGAS